MTFKANDSIVEPSLATRIDATGPVVAERAVYVTEGPLAPAATGAPGVSQAGRRFTFAEGSTQVGFDEYLLIQNPSTTTASAQVTFLRPSGPIIGSVPVAVAPGARTTVHLNDIAPGEVELGAVVDSDTPVLAERAQYFHGPGRTDATAVTGIAALASRWILVEGSTGPGYDEWVLVANPATDTATVAVTLLTPGGSRPGPVLSVRPGGRSTLHVNTLLTEYSVSVRLTVTSGPPVAAERTMFIAAPGKVGATGSEGTPLP
jgi:hypothetical protein